MAGTFFTIEIRYRESSQEHRYVLRNMTTTKLKEFREVVVCAGLMLPVARAQGAVDELDHWRIIMPNNIESIDVWKQKSFFYADNQKS